MHLYRELGKSKDADTQFVKLIEIEKKISGEMH